MSIGPEYKKQYGLIIPKSKETAPVKKRPLSSVFNVDSDEEDDAVVHNKDTSFKNMKRQAKIDIQRALEDDPSVYQYDEIYDDMKEDKAKKLVLAKQDKTSKYAKNLIRNAAVRKLENDRHFERQCQKELEDEGDEFADKESFVTSSYKNKLAELAVLEEEHKRMAEEEKRNDVTKKKDLTDFYRNILSLRTADVASSVAVKSAAETSASQPDGDVKTTEDAITEDTITEDAKTEDAKNNSQVHEPEHDVEDNSDINIKKNRLDKKRTYRARKQSDKHNEQTGSEGSSEDACDNDVEKENDEKAIETKNKGTAGDSINEDANPDKDDSSSSSDDDDEDNEEGNAKSEQVEPVIIEEKKTLFLTEEEKRDMRIKLVKESCMKRNTPETIQAAIERYWQRQTVLSSS